MRMIFFTIRLHFLHSAGMLDVSNSFRGMCRVKCHLRSLHSIMKWLPMDTWCFCFMGIAEEIMVVCSVTSLAALTALTKMVKGIVERILFHSIDMIEPVFFRFQIKIENRWIPFPGTCHDNVRKRIPFTVLEWMHRHVREALADIEWNAETVRCLDLLQSTGAQRFLIDVEFVPFHLTWRMCRLSLPSACTIAEQSDDLATICIDHTSNQCKWNVNHLMVVDTANVHLMV